MANPARPLWNCGAGKRSRALEIAHQACSCEMHCRSSETVIPGGQTAERCFSWMTESACLGQAMLSLGSGQSAMVSRGACRGTPLGEVVEGPYLSSQHLICGEIQPGSWWAFPWQVCGFLKTVVPANSQPLGLEMTRIIPHVSLLHSVGFSTSLSSLGLLDLPAVADRDYI